MKQNREKYIQAIYAGEPIEIIEQLPRSKITGRYRQESIGNRWNVEAVFPQENFWIFSDDFRPVPAGKHGKLTGIHWKKIRQISGRNTASTSGYFRCFPA